MDILAVPFLHLCSSLMGLLQFFLFVFVIMDWLVKFKILNIHNNFVHISLAWMDRLLTPLLDKIRRFLPQLSVDIPPIILILLISFLQGVIIRILMKIS